MGARAGSSPAESSRRGSGSRCVLRCERSLGHRGLLRQPHARGARAITEAVVPGAGRQVCLANCRSRPWEPHKYATREEQDERLELLLAWVEEYYSRSDSLSLADHRALFDGYAGGKLLLTQQPDRWFVEAQPLRWFSEEAVALGPRFEACAVPAKSWTHAAHLSVGLWHVERYGREQALVRLRTVIRRLNESHGGVNSATHGYHETITAAYVELLAQFLESREDCESSGETVARLLNGALAARNMLLTFYSRERLMSPMARAVWVEPDLGPLRLAAVFAELLRA
jgi:hypothetical protein